MMNTLCQFSACKDTQSSWTRRRSCFRYRFFFVALSCILLVMPDFLAAQTLADAMSPSELKKLSVEELMSIEVTSVSRRSEKLYETASAIQVITQEDIHRFGATRLPEALRLATNLEVAQVDAGQWAISARGFNSTSGNKLLVLIDGRTVYSPLFAGMFWDIQDVLLEDVERIEVISGPGGALWGANAVNGVINIITKRASESHGFLAEGGGGKELRGFGSVRYGGAVSSKTNLRVYGKYSERDGAVFANGEDMDSDWNLGQGGFRLDSEPSDADMLTLQGDYYQTETFVAAIRDIVTETKGGNVLGRWSHTFSETSNLSVQFYYDRVHRSTTGSFDDILNTYDIDWQHRFLIGERHDIVWGAGYRQVRDNFESGTLTFVPQHLSLPTYSAFVQDEIALQKERVYLTIGSKVLHNYYTGIEFQPSARMTWKFLSRQQTLWAAVSRAVRTPSRIDRDLSAPGVLVINPDFDSEILFAYELGYRIRPHERLSFSLAVYYNDYDDIRSVEKVNPPDPRPVVIANGQEGETYGAELIVDYQPTQWCTLRAGYTTLSMDIWAKPGSNDTSAGASEGADPDHYFTLRASLDLPANFKFFPAFRHVGRLEQMDVPAYSELDLRLAWQPKQSLELSIAGQNLLHNHHAEFGREATRNEIERTLYAKILWRF
jgi:iron complex outermembrane receptor protein